MNLLFLANELQNPYYHKKMRLPLRFISFGITKGKMYRHYRNNGTFILPHGFQKAWGNSVVYGGIFLCDDFDFYRRILDSYHLCSMSTLFRNHDMDLHHREIADVIPIYFNTLEELSRLKYTEGEAISVQRYIGNIKHKRILSRTNQTISYRIVDGIDENFIKLYEEVVYE